MKSGNFDRCQIYGPGKTRINRIAIVTPPFKDCALWIPTNDRRLASSREGQPDCPTGRYSKVRGAKLRGKSLCRLAEQRACQHGWVKRQRFIAISTVVNRWIAAFVRGDPIAEHIVKRSWRF